MRPGTNRSPPVIVSDRLQIAKSISLYLIHQPIRTSVQCGETFKSANCSGNPDNGCSSPLRSETVWNRMDEKRPQID
jgi:hypothetical protein